MENIDKFISLVIKLKKISKKINLTPSIIERHIKEQGLSALFEKSESKKVELNSIYKIFGHKLKVINIASNKSNTVLVTLSCHAAGCCSDLNAMTITCNEKDIHKFKLE